MNYFAINKKYGVIGVRMDKKKEVFRIKRMSGKNGRKIKCYSFGGVIFR